MNKIYETDLALPVKQLLDKNGYDVKSEIKSCDIVGIKENKVVIVELKLSLNLNLLIQAVKRQKLTDHVFIAVPKAKSIRSRKWSDLILLVKRLGLGLILVYLSDEPYAEVVFEPGLFDIVRSQRQANKQKEGLLKEFSSRSMDLNIGGSTGKKLMTSYKENSLLIACCLKVFGNLSPKALKELGTDPKKTNSILSKNYNNWFYRVKVGVYGLTDEGNKAIRDYKEITDKIIEKFY